MTMGYPWHVFYVEINIGDTTGFPMPAKTIPSHKSSSEGLPKNRSLS